MENKLNLEALQENMIELMKPFNDEGVELNHATIHNKVLASNDGVVAIQSSKNLYAWGLQWIIARNGGKRVKFPANWMDQSVAELSEYIMSKQ